MPNSKFEHSVDEILKTVQQRQAEQHPSANDAAVDDILAGLGLGDQTLPRRPAAKAQGAAQPKPAAPAVKPAAQPKPATSAAKPAAQAKPAASAAQPAARVAKPAAQPKPAAPAVKPAAQPKPATPAAKQPAQAAPAPAAVKPAQPKPAKPAAQPKPEEKPAVKPAAPAAPAKAPAAASAPRSKVAPAPAQTAERTSAPQPEPAPAPAPAPKAERAPTPRQEQSTAAAPAQSTPSTQSTQPAPQEPERPAPSLTPEQEREPTREFDPVSLHAASQPKPAAAHSASAPSRPAPAVSHSAPAAADPASSHSAAEAPQPKPVSASITTPAPARAPSAGPTERPLQSETGVLRLNELVDEEFTKFFSETVAVVPEEEEQPEHGGFFHRLHARRGQAQPEEEPETIRPQEQDEATGEVRLAGTDALTDLDAPPPEEQAPAPRRRFVLPRIFGVEAPEEDGPFDEAAPEDALDDYNDLKDAPAVQADLARMRASLQLRCVLTGILAAVLFGLGLAAAGLLPAIPAIDPLVAPAAYLGVSLILLLAAAAVSLPTMRSGLAGLVGTPSPDTMPALAALAAAAQLAAYLIWPDAYHPTGSTLFAAPAALLLFLDAVGKRMMSGVIERNFELVSSGVDHVAAYRLRDKKLAAQVAEGLGEPEPSLLVNRRTTLVKGFLRQSFSERWSDRLAQRLSWALGGCGLLAALIAAIKGGGAAGAVSVLAATLCLGGPLGCTLLSAVPSLLMQKSACRVGAVVPGWSAVQEMSRANVVVVGARDLFPSSSVLLHGIKTFEKERIDLAILYAASVLIEGCDTLRDVFLSIIQNKTEMLYPVENLTHEVGGGFIAWVEHNRVIIGSREMMQAHDIDIPSMDCENRYTRNGQRQPIYLAVSGKLFGMFVVSYRPDQVAADVLHQLLRSGISVLVTSDDFSITAPLIQRVYKLREGSVKVLSGPERKALAPATAYLPESEGCMTHLGSFASFVGGLQAAEGAASGERAAALVQAVSVVCSCLLALLLTFTGGLAGLALPALVLYQAAWSALALAMPLLKKY